MAATRWPDNARVVAARHRWPAVNAAVHVIERFRMHRTGRQSALVAHYGFMSVFPLMLVFATVLGFVLQGDPGLRGRIIDSALSHIPLIGQQVATAPEELKGNVLVLIVGIVTALWAGLRAFNALQTALDDIAEVPLTERPNAVEVRVRSLAAIGAIGLSQVATVIATSLIGVSDVGWLNRILLLVSTLLLNIAALAATYRWLCSRRSAWRHVAPGAIGGGVGVGRPIGAAPATGRVVSDGAVRGGRGERTRGGWSRSDGSTRRGPRLRGAVPHEFERVGTEPGRDSSEV